jgi:hypothetical protein
MDNKIIDECAKKICAQFREYPTAKDMNKAWDGWDDALKMPWRRAATSMLAHLNVALGYDLVKQKGGNND